MAPWHPWHEKTAKLEVSKSKFHTLKRHKKVDHFDANLSASLIFYGNALRSCHLQVSCSPKFPSPKNKHNSQQAKKRKNGEKIFHDFSPDRVFSCFDFAEQQCHVLPHHFDPMAWQRRWLEPGTKSQLLDRVLVEFETILLGNGSTLPPMPVTHWGAPTDHFEGFPV